MIYDAYPLVSPIELVSSPTNRPQSGIHVVIIVVIEIIIAQRLLIGRVDRFDVVPVYPTIELIVEVRNVETLLVAFDDGLDDVVVKWFVVRHVINYTYLFEMWL
jgi:hypothetical protein